VGVFRVEFCACVCIHFTHWSKHIVECYSSNAHKICSVKVIVCDHNTVYSHYNSTKWDTLLLCGDADKFLDRPGRNQATATNLEIYSTYSPRSSVHFIASCSNFCKILKTKNFWNLSVQQSLRGSNDLHVGRKMANMECKP